MTRMKSLKNDMHDNKAFRYHRARHEGMNVASEFYQSSPKFFTRDNAQVNIIGQFRGASIFVVANGPSLRNHDISLMKQPGVISYGMNNGPRTFRPDFWTCVDDPSRFIKSIWLDPRITKFVPHATMEKPIFDNDRDKWEMTKLKVGDCPNVLAYHRNEKFVAERFLTEDKINWGNHGDNGGGRSVMLPVFRIAFLLGFRKIYLVGCDFNMSETNTYHFDEQRKKGAVKCNTNTYKRLNEEYFPQLKPFFDREGLEVYNCNPDSGLKVFPFKPYEEAIAETIAPLGDVGNERTYGLYSKPGAKEEARIEPTLEEKKNVTSFKPLPDAQYQEKTTVIKPTVTMIETPTPEVKSEMPEVTLNAPSPFVEEPVQEEEAVVIVPENTEVPPSQPTPIVTPDAPVFFEDEEPPDEEPPTVVAPPNPPKPPKPPKTSTSNSLLRKPLG